MWRFAGAQIAAVCNESAMIAARELNDDIKLEHIDQALDRVRSGLRKRKPMNPDEKKTAAYHDAGHAVAAWFLQGIAAPPTKVCYLLILLFVSCFKFCLVSVERHAKC